MPHYISVLISQENNATEWVYAQQSDSQQDLEDDTTYDGISKMPRNLFSGKRANDTIRIIKDNHGIGGIQVVTYKGTFDAINIINFSSKPATKGLLKKVMTFEKNAGTN